MRPIAIVKEQNVKNGVPSKAVYFLLVSNIPLGSFSYIEAKTIHDELERVLKLPDL
jgi:hypothetical protein